MKDNPYSPPSSTVADVDAGQPLERPPEVRRAIVIFWISVAIAIPSWFEASGVDTSDPENFIPLVMGWVFAVAMMAFTIFVVVSMGRARNWARLTYLILAALGWVMMAADMPGMFDRPWYYWSGYLANAALDVAIVILLFRPASNDWFRAGGRRPADAPS